MQTALVELAQFGATISTPHYLYLNEAIKSAVESGVAAEVVGDLSLIEGHDAAVAQCKLPPTKGAEELLFHLSQTTPYHRLLVQSPRMAHEVFKTLNSRTELPFGQLSADLDPVSQAMTYDPAQFDASRALGQSTAVLWCTSHWGKLPAMQDHYVNLMDLLQGNFHMLYSAFMFYGAIEYGDLNEGYEDRLAFGWLNLMENYVLKLLPQSVDFVASRIHGFREATLVAVAKPNEPLSALEGNEIPPIVNLAFGLDLGLNLFHQRLSNWNGSLLSDIAESISALRAKHTIPFVRKLTEIINRDSRGTRSAGQA